MWELSLNMKKFQRQRLLGFFLLLPLFLAIYISGANANPPVQPPGLDIAKQIQEENSSLLMDNPEVVGTAVGLDKNGKPVIKVFTLTDKHKGIPDNLGGVPVEVDISGMFVARDSHDHDPTVRFERPVPIGISTGHPDITAGTIGCRAVDEVGNFYALSNNHVYADNNLSNSGDNVIQPGTYDGGSNPEDAIGVLVDFDPILFNGSQNLIDAAIALTTTNNLGSSTPSNGYGTPTSSYTAASIGMNVKKYGRTTGLTNGTVLALNATVDICYKVAGPFCRQVARFVDQIIITPGNFSAGGDSGSLIVDNNNNPVGLLFAGSSSYTIANEIENVFTRFDIVCDNGTFVSSCTSDADCDDSNGCTTDSCDTSTGECKFASVSDCCGNDVCELAEDQCICSADCGASPSTEVDCSDGVDNDCDGTIDGDDIDCLVSSCLLLDELCSFDEECCSGKCKGKPGEETCR